MPVVSLLLASGSTLFLTNCLYKV